MVEHLVLFKIKPEATPEQLDGMLAGLKRLPEQIDGILELTVGRNFSDRSQGHDIGLLVRFRDRAALETYLPHPAHRACVENDVRPVMESVIVVDYEVD